MLKSNRSPGTAVSSLAVEQLEDRRLMSASYPIGINMNDSAAATVAKVVPTLNNLGVQSLRLWTSVSDFNNHSMNNTLQRAIDYSNAGFDITLEVANDNGVVPNADAVKGWFQWAVSNPDLKNAVDHWEIGNEPDSSKYWQGTLASYVTGYLKPAYEALHPMGEDVISAGPSWNPADVQTMINNGLLNYTDYVGFHPYANGVQAVKNVTAQINAVVAGRKPIAATEWNVRGFESNKTAWAAAVAEAYPTIKAGFALNYYFAMKVQNSLAGPGGIFTSTYSYNQPFYNAFATFKGSTTTPTTPTTPTTGNTAAGSTGSITGVLFNDLNKDGYYNASDSITGSRVVYIDTNANGSLDAGEKSTTSANDGTYTLSGLAKGTYNVTRVFPSGYKLSNSAAGYVVTTVAASQKVTGINLGTTYASSTITPPSSSTPVGTSGADVPAIRLINPSTGQIIPGFGYITSNAVLSLSSLPTTGIAVEAIGTNSTESMKLVGLGQTLVDNTLSYSFTPSRWYPSKGSYTFAATAYTGDNATGAAGSTRYFSVTFT